MIDVEVLCEAYSSLKQYIPIKDRQDAVDSLMSRMVDMLDDEDFQQFGTSDPILRRSYEEYVGEDEPEETGDLYE